MKIKDSTIITTLILTWIAVACGVLGAENEISRLEQEVSSLYSAQNTSYFALSEEQRINSYQGAEIAKIREFQAIQDIRLNMHRDALADNAQMFSDLLNSMEGLEEHLRSLPDNALGIKISDTEVRMIASLVYLECGNCSYKCQKAVASVIFNRMLRYSMTAKEVIYEPGVFSPASRVKSTTPSASCMMAVREVLEEGCTLPRRVVAFRNRNYHNFGHPYCSIDGVYFSAV